MNGKNLLLLFIAITATVYLTGCTSDTDDGGGHGSRKTITFTLPASTKTVTYAVDTQQGEDDISHLDIYMFDKSTEKLEAIFFKDDINLVSNKATIDVTERTGGKIFYFIGNGNGITSELGKVRYGETTYQQFREMLCDVNTELLATPLLMSARTEIANIASPTDDEKKIKLRRRVARFDIDNDSTKTNFAVTGIMISNVNQQGYIFGDATGTAPAIVSGNAKTIPFNTEPDHNTATLSQSVFYTYPTVIGKNRTNISLEGRFRGGDVRVYTMSTDTDFPIEANKRYKITPKVININEVEFTFTIDPWVAADEEIETGPEENKIAYSKLTVVSGDGKLTGGDIDLTTVYDVSELKEPSVLKFTGRSTYSSGSKANVYFISGSASDLDIKVTATTPQLVYAGAYYEQAFEVNIPHQYSPVDIDAIVELVNLSDPIQVQKFRIVCDAIPHFPASDGTLYPGVRVGGLWWAPMNVKANNINGNTTSEADAGRIFQWGRDNDGWVYNGTANPAIPNLPYAQTMDDAMSEANRGKFINLNQAEPYHWLKPADFTLWSGTKSQGPCPEGWRLPSKAEFEKLANAAKATGRTTVSDRRFIVKGDIDGETLNLVFSGYKAWNFTDNPNHYYYHSSEASGNRIINFIAAKGSATGFNVTTATTAACGVNIRCVAK